MKDTSEYLSAFQTYAKLLLNKIHPDRHHGYPNIQKINASVTGTINELFKFRQDRSGTRHQSYNLHFFTWKTDKLGHSEIFHKLIFNSPFDYASGKSALGLFKAANIPVNFSILDSLFENENQNKPQTSTDSKDKSFTKDMHDGIKQSCFDLDQRISDFNVQEISNFFRSRPYIQFNNDSSNDLYKILKVGSFLLYIIEGIEARMGSNMPLIIISNLHEVPSYVEGIVHLPLTSNFKGINTYFLLKIIIISLLCRCCDYIQSCRILSA